MKFKEKVVFITGTNRGIGKALVQSALDLGASKLRSFMLLEKKISKIGLN